MSVLDAITINPPEKANACVICLHGLGATGHDFADIIPRLDLPPSHGVRFIFPHAVDQPITVYQNMPMPAWYDILTLDFKRSHEDEAGIKKAAATIQGLLQRLNEEHIPSERIVLMGFSQGGALALYTALRFTAPLAGVAGLSTYLPLPHTLQKEKSKENANIPLLIAHGSLDTMVPYAIGEKMRDFLQTMGYVPEWYTYPMAHTVCLPQLVDMGKWIKRVLRLEL